MLPSAASLSLAVVEENRSLIFAFLCQNPPSEQLPTSSIIFILLFFVIIFSRNCHTHTVLEHLERALGEPIRYYYTNLTLPPLVLYFIRYLAS